MIRDLKAPESDAVIGHHDDYFHRASGIGPLFRLGGQPIRREREEPPAPVPPPRSYEPPDPLDEAKFRTEIEETYDRDGLLQDDFIRMIQTHFNSEVLVGCPVLEGVTRWAEPCFTNWHQLDDYRVQETIWYKRIMENTRRALHSASRQHFLAFAEIPKVGLQCSVDEIWLPTGERKNLGPSMGELIPLFESMCERTTLMIDGYWEDDVIDQVVETLPQKGYAIRGSVEDPETVRRKYSQIELKSARNGQPTRYSRCKTTPTTKYTKYTKD